MPILDGKAKVLAKVQDSYQKVKKIYQSNIKEFHKRYVKLICKSNKNKTFSISLIGFDGKSKKIMNDLNFKNDSSKKIIRKNLFGWACK